MYCSVCGRKLQEGEVCLCTITDDFSEKRDSVSCGSDRTQFPDEQADKKAKRKSQWKRLLISVVISFVFCLSSIIIPEVVRELRKSNAPQNPEINVLEGIEGDFILESSDAEYTKGTVNGNTYSNPWANFKVNFDTRFEEGTEEDYYDHESLLYDCGACFIADDDGDEIAILFYDAGNTTVTEYVEESFEVWQNTAETTFEETYSEDFISKITYRRDAKEVELAGEKYLASFLIAEVEGEEFITYCDICAKKDGRIIDIIIAADNVDECLKTARDFEICSGYGI